MRAWLAPILACSLLSVGGAADGIASRRATDDRANCTASPSRVPAGCADLQALARFAAAAYHDQPMAPPSGFLPAKLVGLPLAGGRYTHAAATALVMTGQIDRAPVLVVAFGGSEDRATWLADLRNINAPYRAFRPLIRAIELYAATGRSVLLVGHSFGGAIVQLFMFEHLADDKYRAVTFGSPGALPEDGVFAAQPDARVTNYVIADDPYVFLGEHRADVAGHARRNPLYAFALASGIARESGLSLAEVVATQPYLSANYVNNGARVVLPSHRAGLDVRTVVGADPDEHEIETYAERLGPVK